MTASTQTTAHGNGVSSSQFFRFASAVAKFGAKAKANAASTLRSLQAARMMSTLANLSDSQLAQIGISRSDIPKYAESLMSEE